MGKSNWIINPNSYIQQIWNIKPENEYCLIMLNHENTKKTAICVCAKDRFPHGKMYEENIIESNFWCCYCSER